MGPIDNSAVVPSHDKPLPEPILTKIDDAL